MQDDFSLEAYDYDLPQKNIAQRPAEKRDESRLLVLDRRSGEIKHRQFSQIVEYFNKGDILVMNDTKVFPARLFGKKTTGGKAEVFLLEFPRLKPDSTGARVFALVKSSKRPKIDSEIYISNLLRCRIVEHHENGKVLLDLFWQKGVDLATILSNCGTVPLPPYIERNSGVYPEDRERYQTVYAKEPGAVAAPTAGLHFTDDLLLRLREKGVQTASLTLHVGYGTFAPVRSEAIRDHKIHQEYISLSGKTAEQVNKTKKDGGKVWAIGTTSVRTLEFCCDGKGELGEKKGWCDLYIYPGYRFKVIDNLITNFHLPRSSLLFLVSALCGRKTLLHCYHEAIARDYRFYSYGDAMAIVSE